MQNSNTNYLKYFTARNMFNSAFNLLDKIKDVFSKEPPLDNNALETKFIAAMVLAGAGDAMGYNNGLWEFCKQGITIHQEVEAMGGVDQINTFAMGVSDDQVMHLATAEALIEANSQEELFPLFATHYIKSMDDMEGRAPGNGTKLSIAILAGGAKWNEIPYSPSAGGCGAAMRSMCIGLVYYGEQQRQNLIAASIESGRITHNNPIGFLGSLASALFTAYAIENIPIVQWGRKMINEVLPKAYDYLRENGRCWEEYKETLHDFQQKWTEYLEERDIMTGDVVKFPEQYGVEERDKFYTKISYQGWGGSSGHDAPMIAYDALLGSGNNWNEFALRGILHGGDNDTTGCIGGSLFGALFGFEGVPSSNYRSVEYKERASDNAKKLFLKAQALSH